MDFIVVGLGNPGISYKNTRHNIGWNYLEYMAKKINIKIKKIKFKSTYAETEIDGKKILILKPQTYMNASGESVFAASEYYKVPPENIIVVCDDISLPSGKIRIRRSGSDGGHKGLKNIIYLLNSDNFPRIKIGVSGKPNPDMDLGDWVLGEIPKVERRMFEKLNENIFDAVKLIINEDIDVAMSKYN